MVTLTIRVGRSWVSRPSGPLSSDLRPQTSDLRPQSSDFRRDEEEHGPHFLWIYDVWQTLYGKEFADAQVAVEKRRGGPYPKAWDEALALTREERAAKWRAVRDERLPSRR
jgi:hypothetical protein